jgi:hypothetical protein
MNTGARVNPHQGQGYHLDDHQGDVVGPRERMAKCVDLLEDGCESIS